MAVAVHMAHADPDYDDSSSQMMNEMMLNRIAVPGANNWVTNSVLSPMIQTTKIQAVPGYGRTVITDTGAQYPTLVKSPILVSQRGIRVNNWQGIGLQDLS